MPEEILLENLNLISEAIDVITKRFSGINAPDDLVSSEYGVLILDSVAMTLQVIGELLKKVHKGNPTLLENYPKINWRNIMRFRDIISHHYEKVDHEIIFDICQNNLPELKKTICTMILTVR
ncbi:MAG: DUF86 domain-containing protein [Desulfobacterium sp.]|jgi:uncharacterized protein with HEPN domain|nr:DUF86 domain-containing protein [Desulfobacterium sp.]